jgi:hypothetical protein
MICETFDIGDTVVCDLCNRDYTDDSSIGGFLFGSKGVCPMCAPVFEQSVKKYGEEAFIKARAMDGEPFKDFIIRIRDGNNAVTITTF